MKIGVNKMVKLAILAALSIVFMIFIRFPIIPSAAFLEYEPGDVPILIGTFLFGPVAGLLITFVVALIQAFTVSASSGWVGFIMHVIATGTLALVAGAIYRKFNTRVGGIVALIVGSLCMTLIMIPTNLYIDVKFYGMTYDAVKVMIPTAIIPFNLIKALVNSAIVFFLYKSAGKVLRANEQRRTTI